MEGPAAAMLLYHFTSRQCLRHILAGGLSCGRVPVSATASSNAVWLTTDPGPNGHGLEAGGTVMTEAHRQQAYEWTGVRPPPGARHAKEASVRITLDIDRADRNLHEWLPWARRHLAPDWFAELHPIASPNWRKAKTWRLYFGVIPADAFVAVEAVTEPAAASALSPAVLGLRL
jgi:hypothetical protein